MSILQIESLCVAYDGAEVVRGFDLTLKEGESYGLVGESGCGKSTVAFAVEGHLAATGKVTSGSITVNGTALTKIAEPQLRRLRAAHMSMVFQDPVAALNPTMRIGDQLAEAAREPADILPIMDRVRLPDPEALLKRYPHQLSGGQLQRVVIAMALLSRPSLLILDEPTTGLDVTVEAEVVALISEIAAAEDVALLYISHNLGLMARVADRIGIMYAGQLVEEGPVRSVLRSPKHPYTLALLACLPGRKDRAPGTPLPSIPGQVPLIGALPRGCAFAPRCAMSKPGLCDVDPPLRMVQTGTDHFARCRRLEDQPPMSKEQQTPPTRDLRAHDTVLEIDGLRKTFGRRGLFAPPPVVASDDVGFTLPAAQTLALVGESGSGKSTLARMLIGLDVADKGTAMFDGKNIAALPAKDRPDSLIRQIQMVFQNPDGTLNPAHRIGFILARALKRAGQPHGEQDVIRLLDSVRLPATLADRHPADLSGGQRQRVAIARAFAGSPALIVADEPVSALDVSVQAAVIGLLSDMTAAHDTAILLISHDLMLVRHVAQHVVVLYQGRVMEQGPADAVFKAPFHPYTEALLASVHPPDPDHVVSPLDAPDDPGPSPQDGCPFYNRCHRRLPQCSAMPPPKRDAGTGHAILCHRELQDLVPPERT